MYKDRFIDKINGNRLDLSGTKEVKMKKVAIMGFGRIGRDVLREHLLNKNDKFEIVALVDINAKDKVDFFAHLFKYDSIYGRYPGEVSYDENHIIIDGKKIEMISEGDPLKIDWGKRGVDIVIDSTGVFRTKEKASFHLQSGAKKVVITAPAKGADVTIVMGVNDKDYDSTKHDIISNASCTTNCLAPVVKVLNDNFKIKRGFMTTVHAYTNDQNIHDSYHKKDYRRARAAAVNIVPTSTGAAEAVGLVVPEVAGKLTGFALRVPVITGSIVDLTCEFEKKATVEEVNAAIKKASEGELKNILKYSEDPIVSTDVVKEDNSSVFDSLLTKEMDGLMKVVAWYDNEWGYSKRVLDITNMVAEQM